MVEKPRSVSNQKQRFRRRRPNTSVQRRSGSQRYNQRDGRARYELSVVIPLYNEEESVDELARRVKNALSPLGVSFEVIFVDDGSTDRSFDRLKEIHRHDRRFRIIRFRRNYGKSAALSVGFRHAAGSYIITLDADLQDDPSEIPRLLDMLRNDYDLISGWKKKRHDPISKKVPSRLFNFVVSKMTGIKIHDFNCGLKGYR
ncbi:MAG: glycosyltransferase family 2 protein, partial [Bacteroidota bacterium]